MILTPAASRRPDIPTAISDAKARNGTRNKTRRPRPLTSSKINNSHIDVLPAEVGIWRLTASAFVASRPLLKAVICEGSNSHIGNERVLKRNGRQRSGSAELEY